MSRRALEKVVDQTARAYLAKLGCCPPGLLASYGDDKGKEWHGAFEEEVARAVRNSLAKQGIGPPTKPQAWLLEAKAAAKAEAAAAAAAAEAKLSKAGKSSNGKSATSDGDGGSSSTSSKASGSSKQAASSSSGGRAADAGMGSVANGADASPADSSSASADPASKAASTGAVRIYRDDSSGASSSSSSSSGTAPKRQSPSRPPAGASVSTVRYETVRPPTVAGAGCIPDHTTITEPLHNQYHHCHWLCSVCWINSTEMRVRPGGRSRLQRTKGARRPAAVGSGRSPMWSWKTGSGASTRD